MACLGEWKSVGARVQERRVRLKGGLLNFRGVYLSEVQHAHQWRPRQAY